MSKPLSEMHSHEISNELQIEQLRESFREKSIKFGQARKQGQGDLAKTLETECQHILVQLELLDPNTTQEYKDALLDTYAENLTKKLHSHDS